MFFPKLSTFFAFTCVLFLISLPVFAAGLVPCNGLDCTPCYIFAGFSNIINFIVFTLTPPAAGVMIVVSGIILIFGGSESAKTMGKKMFTSVIIGLIIVYSSWLVVNTIIQALGRQTEGWVPAGWNQAQCTK
jgi:hypothetical protein